MNILATHVRDHLTKVEQHSLPLTYQTLAKSLGVLPPQTIRQITDALEFLMQQDTASDRPFIAAFVVSKSRGGLPALGFFECAQRLGRFHGDPSCADAIEFYVAEFNAAVDFWCSAPADPF